MIQLNKQVPEVYYSHSRDFQFLGRLFDLVLNAVKTNADILYQVPNGVLNDTRSIELLALTLGFNPRHNYDRDQLTALINIFPTLLKYKGTITAIKIAGDALIRASNVIGDFNYELKNNTLEVVLPYELTDISLFLDLLPYILPAGITCSISRGKGMQTKIKTKVATAHQISTSIVNRDIRNDGEGLSIIRPLESSDKDNKLYYTYDSDFISNYDNSSINKGLIGTTQIPALYPDKDTKNTNTEET